jgi:hypothetical protein
VADPASCTGAVLFRATCYRRTSLQRLDRAGCGGTGTACSDDPRTRPSTVQRATPPARTFRPWRRASASARPLNISRAGATARPDDRTGPCRTRASMPRPGRRDTQGRSDGADDATLGSSTPGLPDASSVAPRLPPTPSASVVGPGHSSSRALAPSYGVRRVSRRPSGRPPAWRIRSEPVRSRRPIPRTAWRRSPAALIRAARPTSPRYRGH